VALGKPDRTKPTTFGQVHRFSPNNPPYSPTKPISSDSRPEGIEILGIVLLVLGFALTVTTKIQNVYIEVGLSEKNVKFVKGFGIFFIILGTVLILIYYFHQY
jgi:hypothetical protein